MKSPLSSPALLSSLPLRLLQAGDRPPGEALPVDMQSASLSNQRSWKVVTNGPQGGESTLNIYTASAGILQVRAAAGMSQVASLHASPPRRCDVDKKENTAGSSNFYDLAGYFWMSVCHSFIYWAWGVSSKSATYTNL